MKKRILPLALALGIFLSLAMTAKADDSSQLYDTITDNLTSDDDVKWYSFELKESGNAVILVTGLRDHSDGYTYHWNCAIYEDDQETLIASRDVRGYSDNEEPSILSAPDLKAGTYYIRMVKASSGNPFMTTFTSDPYKVQLFRYYPSQSAAYQGDGYQTFHNAGDILWSFDGTAFLKLNDGECFGALMKSSDGAIAPILISTDEAAVEYIISNTGQKITAAGPWEHDVLGTDFYYSDCSHIDQYANKMIDTSSLPILYMDSNDVYTVAQKVISRYVSKEYDIVDAMAEQEEHKQKISTIIKATLIAGIVLVAIVIFCGHFVDPPVKSLKVNLGDDYEYIIYHDD